MKQKRDRSHISDHAEANCTTGKWWIFFALVLILMLSGGCAGLSSISQKDDQVTSNLKEKPITIDFWRPQAHEPENQFYLQAVERFNLQNSGKIQIHMEVISRGNSFAYEDKVYAALASNVLPDLISLDGPNVANYASMGIISPLDTYYHPSELTDFLPGILKQGTYDGKLYAIGQSESSVVLYYNRKILADHGISPPSSMEQAWTWEDWYQAMKTCADEKIVGTNMIGDQGEWMTYAFEQFWISNGTDLVSPDGHRANGYVNSPRGVEAAEFLARLAKEGLFHIDPSPTEFEEGKAATKLGGPWNIPGFSNFPDLDWGLTYFPRSPQGIQTAPSGNWALAITTNCENPEIAVEVIQYLTNLENGIALSRAISMPPARRSAYLELPEYNEQPLRIIREQVMTVSRPRPITPAYPVLTQKFAEALIRIMRGSDIQRSLDDVATTYDLEYAATFSP